MFLTAAEFCRFNLKSRMQLLSRDGILLRARPVLNKYIVKLYKIYQFLVEVIIRIKTFEVVKAEPVLNKAVISMYDLEAP